MKNILAKALAFLKKTKLHWWIVIYAGFGILAYIHFLGILGLIAMAVCLVVFNSTIHALGDVTKTPSA